MSGAPSEAQQAAELSVDALAAVGRLRRLWPWLADAREPGVPGTASLVQRRISDAALRVEDEQVRRDRRAAAVSIRAGLTPTSEHPAPARLSVVRTRLAVAGAVRAVGSRLEVRLPAPRQDPSMARTDVPCTRCAGTGKHWLRGGEHRYGAGSCQMCGGHGRRCAICRASGPCHCNLADVITEALLEAVADELPKLTSRDDAGYAAQLLARAERACCSSLGLVDVDLRVISAPCPACRGRDLAADVSSSRALEWSVSCRSVLCRCTGPGCRCGRPVRWEGRRHRWPSGEFTDLARVLGVRLPLGEVVSAAR